jgi:hypothetical protein
MLKSQSLIIIITLKLECFRLEPRSVIISKSVIIMKMALRLERSRLEPQRLIMLDFEI